jgi:hypothetical protein
MSSETWFDYHLRMFGEIAGRLKGHTSRVIVSFLDIYPKVGRRLDKAGASVPKIVDAEEVVDTPGFSDMMEGIGRTAASAGMEIQSCAEKLDLSRWKITMGKCIDDKLIKKLFGLSLSSRKDSGQRELCGCIPSRDIGAYDTCPNGCIYCYARRSWEIGRRNYRDHDPGLKYLLKGEKSGNGNI